MAAEMHVLFGGKLPGATALTRAMKELGFPLAIKPGVGSLERHSGFMPMRLRREDTGVEFDVFDDRADVEELAGEDFDPRFERSANFRWGSDEDEMLCAMCAAAALAKLVNGLVLEENEDRPLTPDEAIAFARKHLELVKPQPTQRGTRPADIKRYLKPLLELRSDLVLVGRRLLIRPFRHLLRGAFLDRTGDKYMFRVWCYITPVYSASPGSLGYGGDLSPVSSQVWQPHFEPLLIDCLATDIFDELGRMTSLQDFAVAMVAGQSSGWASWGEYLAPISSLVLAGEQDRAADYVQKLDREDWSESHKREIRACWERVTADVPAFCEKMHAQEAENIKALKLDKIWEPSPFPVELPAAQRTPRSAEKIFLTNPWPARPPGLWQELPTEPGDVRFAKDFLRRDGKLALPVALTREEAEVRHDAGENYVLAARLPDGLLLLIRLSGWDRNDPWTFNHAPTWAPIITFMFEVHGESRFV
jgi:hypothetical protein